MLQEYCGGEKLPVVDVKVDLLQRRVESRVVDSGDIVNILIFHGGCLLGPDRTERWVIRLDPSCEKILVGDVMHHAVAGILIEHFKTRGEDPYLFTFHATRRGEYVVVAEIGCFGGGGRQAFITLTVV